MTPHRYTFEVVGPNLDGYTRKKVCMFSEPVCYIHMCSVQEWRQFCVITYETAVCWRWRHPDGLKRSKCSCQNASLSHW